jgi:glycosyltransferase involved in cell wall biosynthesis
MRLAIDASRSLDRLQKTGVEVVSDALLKALEVSCPPNVDITYYTPELISWLPKHKQKIVPGKRFWTVWHLSWALWRDRPDALFVPVHNLPSWVPKRVVRIIHDISSFRTPEAYALKERWLIKRDAERSRLLCRTVFVPTEAVKQDLKQLVGFQDSQVVVTGWALDESLIPRETEPVSPPEHPYLLFIGRLESKKNVAALIEAFRQFQATHPDWLLMLIGKPGHGYAAIEPLLRHPNIIQRGYVTNEEKWQALRAASALVIPSKEEGFSFPMLEAFQAGIPVIASDILPLRDVGGEACVYVPLDELNGFSQAFIDLAEEKLLVSNMIEQGRMRLQKYQWSEVARQVWRALLV